MRTQTITIERDGIGTKIVNAIFMVIRKVIVYIWLLSLWFVDKLSQEFGAVTKEAIVVAIKSDNSSVKYITEKVIGVKNKISGVWTLIKKKSSFFRKIGKFLKKHGQTAAAALLLLGIFAKIGQALLPFILLL